MLVVIIMTGGEPMPAEKVSMRQIREILRLKYGGRHRPSDRALDRCGAFEARTMVSRSARMCISCLQSNLNAIIVRGPEGRFDP